MRPGGTTRDCVVAAVARALTAPEETVMIVTPDEPTAKRVVEMVREVCALVDLRPDAVMVKATRTETR